MLDPGCLILDDEGKGLTEQGLWGRNRGFLGLVQECFTSGSFEIAADALKTPRICLRLAS